MYFGKTVKCSIIIFTTFLLKTCFVGQKKSESEKRETSKIIFISISFSSLFFFLVDGPFVFVFKVTKSKKMLEIMGAFQHILGVDDIKGASLYLLSVTVAR